MAGAMRAAKARLDVSTANLANVSSDGFQRSIARTEFTGAGLLTTVERDPAPGPLRHTGRALDVSIAGSGAFFVDDGRGGRAAVRSASLVRDSAGVLHDERGRAVLGERGVLRIPAGAVIDQDGAVRGDGEPAGRLMVTPGASVSTGFLETANVNAVGEMVEVLSAQRAFETAEQTLAALDGTRSKAVNDVVRVKS